MREHLKRLSSESAYYGISTIGARMLLFLLVPFYTHVLDTGEYGVVFTVYSILAFMNVLFTFGLEPAFMRYYPDCDDKERKDLFSSSFLAILAAGIALAAAIHVFKSPIAFAIGIPVSRDSIIAIGIWTIALDALNAIPFATLRMQNKPRRFAFIRLASISINIALNLYFILYLDMGIESIFTAGLIASGVSTVLLLPTTFSLFSPVISWKTLRPLLVYGLPALPAMLASVTVSAIDKPLLNLFLDSSTVGIYHANYKLGIFMMLVVSMFQFAWQPFYLQMKSEPNAKEMFARVLTYFVLIAMTVAIVLSFFIDDVVHISIFGRTIIQESYWSGLAIVPIILFSYVWTGVYYISNAGIFIENKTKYLPYISGAGAAVNVGMNIVLIPVYGIFGAAYATLGAYFTMAILSYLITQRVYPIVYEYLRLLKVGLASATVIILWYSGIFLDILPELLAEGLLVILFLAQLFVYRFFSKGELAELRTILARFSPAMKNSE
jgi:O-antigen/teichoic acid export membrane protein